MKKKIFIEGMSCNHCVAHVRDALSELEETTNIEVNLNEKYATIETNVNDNNIKDVLDDAGYDVVKIELL